MNIGYLKDFLDYFKDFPLERIGFMHPNYTSEEMAETHNQLWSEYYKATASNLDEVNIENFNLQLLWDEIQNIKSSNYNFEVNFSPELATKKQLDVFYNKPEHYIGKRCDDVFSNIMIKSDGSVIPAHGRCYNLELGNLYQSSLKSIWESKVLKNLRSDLNKAGGLFPACSRCCSAF